MDCAQFREIVHELDRAEAAGFAMRRSALEHADSCSRCNAVLSEVELLESALSRIAAEDTDKQAPARVEAALLGEFRRHTATEVAPKKDFAWAGLGIAAAFVLMLGIGLHYWITQRANGLQQTANHGAQKAGSDAASAFSGAESADEENATFATDFVSLPYADDPATLQGGTIVRVMLSRSGLASFGVPVADLDASDQIPADIALSEDGAPQAIRLVAEDESRSGN